MSDYRARNSFSPSHSNVHRTPSPALPEQRSPRNAMGNPMRYSHGKMMPNVQSTPDAARLSNAQMHNFASSRNLRPSSEMLPMGQQNTPETEVIDKWFEDLQNYEATLEEMAAASLDQNFKEELSAIEQWFRVLSEAERTAALYSLLQESTQVQIRFFITVLQQMARNDPVGAFLSPSSASNAMGEQLEAKMASLGIKTPTAGAASSPGSRAFQRQSTGFLSPNTASLYAGSPDVSAALAAQRSKMKSNRTSAPGTFPMASPMNYKGGTLDQVQEKSSSQSRERPRSSDHQLLSRAQRQSGPIDDALSPLGMGGSWSSMVNTPIRPGLDDKEKSNVGGAGNHPAALADTNAKLDATAAQLAQLAQQYGGDTEAALRARRSGSAAPSMQEMLNTMYETNGANNQGSAQSHANSTATPSHDATWQNPGSPSTNLGSPSYNQFSIPTMSPNTLAGLQSPSGGMSNPANLQMMNTMAAMGGLNNLNSSQLMALQQQILQLQQQNLPNYTPSRMGPRGANVPRGGSGVSMNAAAQRTNHAHHHTSNMPRNPTSGSPHTVPAQLASANQGEEEVADISILNDVPAWLRHLRLHKYTPNFEGSNWREMVQMNEQALIEKGVAALGARRKMLKTFEAVRQKYQIPPPADSEPVTRSESADFDSDHEP
ncbi:Flap-structured DNA-binding and RNA-binding protein [Malassezia psittaci]|uniref:RNA-binding protein VTS1 n=1 Tax=Malassezia psittaci TaxID=1821823 RepID=A0AAF0FC52_9BASI|nr:Flap-structured DNA-binding and RNA-binding protein [Malassezia psittaci]